MGQVLNSIDDRIPTGVLLTPVQSQQGILTQCESYAGTLVEVRRLYERYRRHKAIAGYYVTSADFHVITRNSPLEGLSDAYKSFERGVTRSISMLEFISALVVFSLSNWESKVLYLMRLFDFDNNRCLSRDEVTILCASVMNGFASVTGTRHLLAGQLTTLSDFVFRSADTNPDGLITYDECELLRMKQWVKSVPEILTLLQGNKTHGYIPEPDLVFLFMHDIDHVEKRVKGRGRTRINANSELQEGSIFTQTIDARVSKPRERKPTGAGHLPALKQKNSFLHGRSRSNADPSNSTSLIVRGQVIKKDQVLTLKKLFDKVDKGRTGVLSIEEFRAGFARAKGLENLAQSMFKDFDLPGNESITFDEVLVKTFKGVTQKELTVMLHWVKGRRYIEWESIRYMKLRLPKAKPKLRRQVSFQSAAKFHRLFDLYDTNKSGDLSLEELRSGLGHMFSNTEIEEMFRKYDENEDQKISLTEFMKMMSPDDAEVSEDVIEQVKESRLKGQRGSVS